MRASRANFQPDIGYRVRQVVGPWIDRLARTIGQPEYRIRHTEYVGTVDRPLDELISTLRTGGFTWGPVSWYHRPPVGTSPDGSWTYRPSLLADRQLHVVLCARSPERIDVYAHEEYNWLRHPIKHGRQVGINRKEGATEMRRWLDTRGVDFDYESWTRRTLVDLADRVGEHLLARFGLRR